MKNKIQLLVKALLAWYSTNARDLPWRRTRNPYAVWVSEIMLQQTQVKTVIPYWERWLRELPTIEAAAKASPDKLHKLWEGLGYYTRVRNLQKAAQVIVDQHHGKFPERFEDVLALPGIGRYTAGAICSIAFNQPTPILDGNVIRVLTRVFGIAENPKEKETNKRLWHLAQELVTEAAKKSGVRGHVAGPNCRLLIVDFRLPKATGHSVVALQSAIGNRQSAIELSPSHLNQSLMELGALVCLPRNAQCDLCPLKKLCVAFREDRVEELPNLGKRSAATARHFAAFVLERNGKFLVRQRPAGVVNAHLWEFPNVEINGSAMNAAQKFHLESGLAAREFSPLLTIKHSITRYRITLQAFRVQVGKADAAVLGSVWKTASQMRRLAFTSAHRRILEAALSQ